MKFDVINRPAHEALLLELSGEEYSRWKHNPVTAAYLLYLKDNIDAFRESAADLLESGTLDKHFDVLRGRISTLRELQKLSLDDIRNFYRQEENEEQDGKSVSG